jgi:hypothetical protein
MGYLMRRNILAYKAPPNNEGCDLICIHPDPRRTTKQVRIQVKSRLATDHGGGFMLKASTLGAFDYLIVVYLNVGYFFGKRKNTPDGGRRDPDFYTLPAAFVRRHHDASSRWEKVNMRGLDLSRYHNYVGFEQIARALGVRYPEKRAETL